MSNFLSFHNLNNEFFIKGFCRILQARVVIFGMQVADDVLHCRIANQPSAYFSPYV